MKRHMGKVFLFTLAMLSSSFGWTIEDSMIFENIESQNKTYSKILETNKSQIPVFSKSENQEIVVEDVQKSFVAKTSINMTQFEKEKPSKKQQSSDLNKKKIERIAEEIKDLPR